MKTRLTTRSRSILISHARSLIRTPIFTEVEAERLAAVHDITDGLYADNYPAAEMDVIAKWNLGAVQAHIEVRIAGRTSRHDCVHAPLRTRKHFPSRYGGGSCDPILDLPATHPVFAAVTAYENAVAARKEAAAIILADYEALIAGSRNYEDVVEVWPEAKQVATRLGVRENVISTLSADVVARIKADSEARAVAVSE